MSRSPRCRTRSRASSARPACACSTAARALDARAAVDGFATDLAALQGMARGELLVASIQSLNATLLPAPIARFVARYPGVALGVRTHPAEAIAQAVRHGRE